MNDYELDNFLQSSAASVNKVFQAEREMLAKPVAPTEAEISSQVIIMDRIALLQKKRQRQQTGLMFMLALAVIGSVTFWSKDALLADYIQTVKSTGMQLLQSGNDLLGIQALPVLLVLVIFIYTELSEA